MKEKFFTRNNVVLFSIAFMVTLLTAIICSMCGAERITVLLTAPMLGVLSVMGIGGLFTIEDMPMPVGPEPGFLGVIVGTLLSLFIF